MWKLIWHCTGIKRNIIRVSSFIQHSFILGLWSLSALIIVKKKCTYILHSHFPWIKKVWSVFCLGTMLYIAVALSYKNWNGFKIQKKKLWGYELSEILDVAIMFGQFCSPTKWSTFAISEGNLWITLNPYLFFQKMLDLRVVYHSLLLSQYQHAVHQHHPVHMLNQIITMCTSTVLLYWLQFTALLKV